VIIMTEAILIQIILNKLAAGTISADCAARNIATAKRFYARNVREQASHTASTKPSST
jgi:site-specific recombinase XerD